MKQYFFFLFSAVLVVVASNANAADAPEESVAEYCQRLSSTCKNELTCKLFRLKEASCDQIETASRKVQAEKKNVEAAEALPETDASKKEKKDKAQKDLELATKELVSLNMKALSDRTAGFKATLGLQVGNEGTHFLVKDEASDTSNAATGWIPNKIIKLMVQIIGTFAILILAFGGLLMITSEGDENRLQNGKNIFFYTIVGLLVAFMSYIGVQFIISVLFTTGGS